MKKFFSLMLVAAAMFAFTACDNTSDMSDDELTAAIVKHSGTLTGFTGEIQWKGEAIEGVNHMAANFDADGTFALYFGEKKKDVKPKNLSSDDIFWSGKWKVLNGKLLITDDEDEVEEWYDDIFIISKEGKRLSYDGESFAVVLD